MTSPTDARPGETTALWCPNCDARGWVCNRPGDHRGPCRFVMPLSLPAARGAEGTTDEGMEGMLDGLFSSTPLCIQCGVYIMPPMQPWTVLIDGVPHGPIHTRCKNGLARRLSAYPPTRLAAHPEPTPTPDAALREAAQGIITALDAWDVILATDAPVIAAIRSLRAALAQEEGR